MDRIITLIPSVSELQAEAVNLTADNFVDNLNDPYPGWYLYMSNDGAGQEGNIAFLLDEQGNPTSAVMWVFDHESNLAADIHAVNPDQPAWTGVPDMFSGVLQPPSPFLWRFDGYPETFHTVYATGAAWNTGDGWVYSAVSPDPDQSAHHFLYSFKQFRWVQTYKEKFASI